MCGPVCQLLSTTQDQRTIYVWFATHLSYRVTQNNGAMRQLWRYALHGKQQPGCAKVVTVTTLCRWHTLQKPAPENWRRFLALVFHASCKISGARNQHGRIKGNQLSIWLSVQVMLNRLNKLNNFNNQKYKQNLQLQQTKTATLNTDQSQISILITWSPDSVAK